MSLWRRTKETPEIPQRARWNENPIRNGVKNGLKDLFRRIRVGNEVQHGLLRYNPNPEDEPPPLAIEYLEAFKEIFGDSKLLDEAINRIIAAGELVEAGWGHGFETQAFVNAVVKIFRKVTYVFSANIVTGKASKGFEVKRHAHSAVQNELDIIDHLDELGLIPKKFSDDPKGYVRKILIKYITNNVKVDESESESPFEQYLRTHPWLARRLLKLFSSLEYELFDKEMGQEVERIRAQLGVNFAFSSHPATMRRVSRFFKKLGQVLALVTMPVDPGYIFKFLKFNPLLLIEEITHGAPMLAPSKLVAKVMKKYYGIEAYAAGTIADVMNKKEVVAKWKDTKTDRWIMGSTSGNGSNMEELATMVDHFRTYQKTHQNSPYTLLLFTGEHSDKKIEGLSNELDKDQSDVVRITVTAENSFEKIIEQVKENRGKIILLRTNDITITTQLKLQLEQVVLVEAVKSGEAPLMLPQVGTFNLLTMPTGPNEWFNALYGVLNGGSVFANFTEKQRALWSKIVKGADALFVDLLHNQLIDDRVVQAFQQEKLNSESGWKAIKANKQFTNAFDQLDDLFGDTASGRETEINRARLITFRGLVNSRNATFAVMAVNLAQLMEIELNQEFYAKLDVFYANERAKALKAIEEMFPDDYKKLQDARPVFE